VASVVTGIAGACQAVGCALIGGETAEMPGVYTEGAFDLAGTVVGLVDRSQLLPRPQAMQAGDCLFGLPSSGPHTNGYSLIRQLVANRDLNEQLADGQTLADALLAPHRCYLPAINTIQAAQIDLLGMAHITGGGFIENLPRVLPAHLQGVIYLERWLWPPLFQQLQRWGELANEEVFRVFNMGIGMILIVPAAAAPLLQATLPEALPIGHLAPRTAEQPAVQLLDAA
jgi:phosphoribosylformylglycinamidine cyclo-ligase